MSLKIMFTKGSSFLFKNSNCLEGHKVLIAGPCAAETELQLLQTARELKAIGVEPFFRAGIWKPRTRPGGFEGAGSQGLRWLKSVQGELGFSVGTEVAFPNHIEEVLKVGLDWIWIGSRTTTSPFAVQSLADSLMGASLPVLVKNPIGADTGLWIGAVERLMRAGIKDIVLVHRGFAGSETSVHKNAPHWHLALEIRRVFPELPLICDPSHMAGVCAGVEKLSQQAFDFDYDGLMIESHISPKLALSDSAQQLRPEELKKLWSVVNKRCNGSGAIDFDERLSRYREQIDAIDFEILSALAQRTQVVKEVGRVKERWGANPLQRDRLNRLLASRRLRGMALGLSEETIKKIFDAIHEEALHVQERDRLKSPIASGQKDSNGRELEL
jgi:chorismate mutase